MPDPETHNHALAYCREKAGPPTSDFGLSRLFAPEDIRDELLALHAYYNELMNVAYTVSDIGVARAKLGWWREELQRAFEGQARHPALQALAGPILDERLKQDDLSPMVSGALANVDPEIPADERALLDFVDGTGTARARAEATLAGAGPDARDAAAELGRASALTMLLVLLPVDLPRGRLLLPMSDLARFQVTRADLQRADPGPALDELIRHRADRARDMLAAGLAALPARNASHLRHLQVQAALDRARLRRIHAAGSRALRPRRDIAPFRRLFIAWRAAGKAQRRSVKSR
jgi:phytoene synthase